MLLWVSLPTSLLYLLGPPLLGWLLHGLLLYYLIDTGAGQNLSTGNMVSLIFWLVALFSALFYRKTPNRAWTTLLKPCLVLSVFAPWLIPTPHVYPTLAHHALIHVLVSVATLAILVFACLQMILYLLQGYLLKRYPHIVLQWQLPALEATERQYRQSLWFSILLLLIAVVSGVFVSVALNQPLFTLKMWAAFGAVAVLLLTIRFGKATGALLGLFLLILGWYSYRIIVA